MYRHLYGLTEKPFQISADPAFLWLGGKHREALAVLVYGVRDSRGFLLLSGGVGTGKTTLIRALLDQLDRNVVVATVHDPGLTPIEFFNFMAAAYGMRRRYTNKVDFLFDFEKFLRKTRASGRSALLIVDESQRLDQTLLEEIRLLSNIEDPDQKLLNVFFVGQEEFLDIVASPENRALKQRITINYHLESLSPEETEQLVRHRLKVAGATRAVFAPDAYPLIHRFSQGAPRLVNILCDHALLTGFVKEADLIGADIIAECIEDLMLPGEHPRHLPPLPPESTAPDRPTAATVTAGMMLQKRPPPQRRTLWPWAAAAGLLLAVGVGIAMEHHWPPLSAPEMTTRKAPAAAQARTRTARPPGTTVEASAAKPEAVEQPATVSTLPEAAPDEPPPLVTVSDSAGTPDEEQTVFAARPAPAPDKESAPTEDGPPPQAAAPESGLLHDPREQPPLIGHEIPDPLPPPDAINGEAPVKRAETDAEEELAAAAPGIPAAPAPLTDNAGDAVPGPAEVISGETRDRLPSPSMVETSARAAALPLATAAAPNDDKGQAISVSAPGDAPAKTIAAVPAAPPRSAETDTTRPPAAASVPIDGVQPPPPPEPSAAVASAPPPSPLGPLENSAPTGAATPLVTPAVADPRTEAPASSPPSADSTEDRLRDFINAYAQAYENLDLDRFRLFFAEDALENGRLFSTVLPTYRKNFAALAGLEYRIDLMSWERDDATGRISLSGSFNVRYTLKDRDWQTTRGEITMDLISNKGVYRVKRLEYSKRKD